MGPSLPSSHELTLFLPMQEYVLVRTTLDLPDDLLRRTKIEAVERGITLRELVAQALLHELEPQGPGRAARKRPKFPIFPSSSPGSLDLTTEDLRRVESEEDQRRHGLSA